MSPRIEKVTPILACPHCGGAMALDGRTLGCQKNHHFDLSRSGYVNTLTRPVQLDYPKEMLAARRRVAESGFFTPLLEALSPHLPDSGFLLDAGCGEGSHLHALSTPSLYGLGLDISKDGIHLAARDFKEQAWVVGDLAALPLQNQSVDGIVNILSPANYGEFRRVLRPGGVLLKVVPDSQYLIQLRQALGQDKQDYSNHEVRHLFEQAFPRGQAFPLTYSFPVSPSLLSDVVAMTPLTWSATPAQRQAILDSAPSQLTMEFVILKAIL